MSDDASKSVDVLGIKPVAEAAKILTQGMVDGAAAFLSRVCLPAAEEYGYLLQDKVRAYRARNVAQIAAKAEVVLADQGPAESAHGHPRLVGLILEHGSWIDGEDVQAMWAGLLASSCSAGGDDDSNLMFIDLLSRLSASQARLVDRVSRSAPKSLAPNGLIVVTHAVLMELKDLQTLTGVTDLYRLDRELDHLRSLELIDPMGGGFGILSSTIATITPTALALQMVARMNGHRGNPAKFYGLSE